MLDAGPGCWTLDLDAGRWTWMLDAGPGCWTLDLDLDLDTDANLQHRLRPLLLITLGSPPLPGAFPFLIPIVCRFRKVKMLITLTVRVAVIRRIPTAICFMTKECPPFPGAFPFFNPHCLPLLRNQDADHSHRQGSGYSADPGDSFMLHY